jgi:SnoaL-like polyketide cyclase
MPADEARRALAKLPPRAPPRLKKLVLLLGGDRRKRGKDAVIWLHGVNGDPIVGRERREYRREIFEIEEEEEEEDGKKEELDLKREVEIENLARHAMPFSYLEGLSQIHVGVTKQVTTDDLVATRWEIIGMHTGVLFGVAPTNREVIFTGMTLLKFEDPIVTEDVRLLRATDEWTYWDLPSLLEQIGAAP